MMDVSFPVEAGREPDNTRRASEGLRGLAVVAIGAALLIGMAYAAMTILTSPDGWVMKAANQAMATAQHGTLASYDIASDR